MSRPQSIVVENCFDLDVWIKCEESRPHVKAAMEAAILVPAGITFFQHVTAGFSKIKPGKSLHFDFKDDVKVAYVTAVDAKSRVICSLLPRKVNNSIRITKDGVE